MPTVSVIITTFNRQGLVQETIASVLAQSFTDFELIVVDDGSTDQTREALRSWMESGKITYIYQENAGLGAARNRGLAVARGEYLAFLDDDDLWPTDKLAWQVSWLRAHQDFGGVTGIFQFFGHRIEGMGHYTEIGHEITLEKMFDGCPCISVGATLLRMDIVKQIGGFYLGVWGTQDYDMWFQIAGRSRFWKENRLALYYRVHPESMSTQTLKVYRNAWQTVKRNLPLVAPAQRRALAQRGIRSTYYYHAQALTWEWRNHLLHGRWRDGLLSLGGILLVAGRFVKYDIGGLGILLRDLLVSVNPIILLRRRTQKAKSL